MKTRNLVFVEPQDSTVVWRGIPAKLPRRIVKLWLPDELDQEIAAEEGSDRYDECAKLVETWRKLRTGEDADGCWDNDMDGDWCGFEWRNE